LGDGQGRRGALDAGFTIAELLVVVLIIGALVGVIVYSLNGIGDYGQRNACRTEKRRVNAAIHQYQAELHRNPESVRALLQTSQTGKRYLDRYPVWFRRIGADGVLRQPGPGLPCHGF
jgi:prepilin-type N-terminal cleavage/methylation domain-containing protein